MKKFISLLICLILLVSIVTTTGYATDVDAIKPNTNVFINGVTGQDTPIHGTIQFYYNGASAVIIPGIILDGEYVNPITGRATEKTENNNNNNNTTTNDDITIEEDVVPTSEALSKDIFDLVNEEREKADLNKLTYNENIQKAADIRAKEIVTEFSHTRPDGTSCTTVIPEEIDYFVTGENIIKADNAIATAENLMNSWMNSQGHKDNILLAGYTSMVVGVYVNNDMTYAVQIFLGQEGTVEETTVDDGAVG